MTNPGDSDEWWKQYGGQGVSPDSGTPGSVPQYPNADPTILKKSSDQPQGQQPPSAPQYPQSSAPQYPQQSAPQYPQQSAPQYPQQSAPQYPQPSAPQYPQQPGYPQAPGYQPYGYPQQQLPGTNGMAIGALVSSLVGFCTCGIGALVGIILGVIALNQIKERPQDGKGMAQAGIWVGAGVIVLWVIYVIAIAVSGL